MLSRRDMLRTGGALLAGLPFSRGLARGTPPVEIIMRGNADGSLVWFDPIGLLVKPGQTIRWTNKDPGNSHTSTAYHPANDGHPLRIPAGALPWGSDYLLPDEAFSITLLEPGVYDYFCVPHEHAGMVGRLVVMEPGGSPPLAATGAPIEGLAKDLFPPVDEIIRRGKVLTL
jgi:plastocyanin